MVYCTSVQVASFIGKTTDFDGSSNPTQTTVNELIASNTTTIDKETMHAWESRTVTEEMHHQDSLPYGLREGVKIFLNHRIVTTFLSGTDLLEIWDGTQFLDYVANKVEDRNRDFWVDYPRGIITIKNITFYKYFSARVTYRYGETSVDTDIRKACILLTAADLAGGDDRSILFPEGTSNVSLPDKVEKWRSQAAEIISDNRETKVVGI